MRIEFFYTDDIENTAAVRDWMYVPQKGDWIHLPPRPGQNQYRVEGFVAEVGWSDAPKGSLDPVAVSIMIERYQHRDLSKIIRRGISIDEAERIMKRLTAKDPAATPETKGSAS